MSDDNQLVEVPNQAINQRVPGDVVNRVTQDLPDRQRSAIRRLHAYYIEQGMGSEETSKLIGYSKTVAGLLFRGKYTGNLDDITKAIEDFFELHEKRSQGRRLNFIPNSLTKRIWSVCHASLEFQKVGFIFGDGQVGKSEALIQFAREHNHGATIYVRMPARGTLSNFLVACARKIPGLSENLSIPRLRERIKAAFDDRMIFIVDEINQCVDERGRSFRGFDTVEYIREIFDEKQCGMIICGNNDFSDAMETGPFAKLLQKFKRRRLCTLQLPNTLPATDLNAFAAGYQLDPATGEALALQKRMIEDEALGMWLTLLRMGAKLAAERHQTIKWSHVLSAYAGRQALEEKKY